MQAPSGRAVIATDDDETRRIARNVRAQLTEVSATRRTRYGVQVIDGRLHVDGRILGSQADWPNLQGPHNAQNAAAAVAACRALGLPDAAIASARSEEHTSELQSLMRHSYAVFCLTKTNTPKHLLPTSSS